MERVNKILEHWIYQECLEKIRVCEQERIYCRHHMVHFMDVARIAYILNLEEGLNISKERIYAAALLHDIGRHKQYLEGIPHQEASAVIAPEILEDCGFSQEEITEIIQAIRRHRDKSAGGERNLSGVIYRADKASRGCYACEAESLCDWDVKKKNLAIEY